MARERARRIEARADRTREIATRIVEALGVSPLTRPVYTASLTYPRKPLVTNADELPKEMIREAPDMIAIGKALRAGETIPGAELKNPEPQTTLSALLRTMTMNALTTTDDKPSHDEVIRVLENSLYPGAKRESIELVLAYCRSNGLDPMLRPVYIVPTSVKKSDGTWETRDLLMPGIADYRIKAARSGEYGGKSEPEFGPDVRETLSGVAIAYPAWCRITVRRIVQGQAREFVATERWLEGYATAKRDPQAPNAMWKTRPYGQLAKVAEAQALRMAFPEFSAGYTMEEMQGKTGADDDWSGATIEGAREAPSAARQAINDATPMQPCAPPPPPHRARPARPIRRSTTPSLLHIRAPRQTRSPSAPRQRGASSWTSCARRLPSCITAVRWWRLVAAPRLGDALAAGPEWVQREISSILAEAYARFPAEPGDDLDEVEIKGQEKLAAG